MPPRKVRTSNIFDNYFRRYRADKAVYNNYRRVVEDLAHSNNPASMGIPKKGQLGGCLGTHITKSVVLVYSVDYATHMNELLKIGDHKTVYRKDG